MAEPQLVREGVVVTTCGCFDGLHPGHVRMLTAARGMGDALVVGLNSDASVRALKGEGRPRFSVEDRKQMLLALSCVDEVVVFDGLLPNDFLRSVRPAVHVKGGDYRALPEQELVEELGGRVVFVPHTGHATSAGVTQPSDEAEALLLSVLQASNSLRRVGYELVPAMLEEGRRMAAVLRGGGRVLVCGNGGSNADAQHFAAELVGRFEGDRRALPALALGADAALLTALANDYGYIDVFARQVRALGQSGDLLLCISTSGRSANVLAAVDAARERGLTTTALTGAGPNALVAEVDHALVVPEREVWLVQQGHRVVLHGLVRLIEAGLGLR